VERDDADGAARGLGQGHFNEMAGELAAAMAGLDVNIAEIAADGRARVERVRGPVKEQEARAGDDLPFVFGKPAEVTAFGNGLRDPGLVGVRHDLQHLIVAASGIDEHAAAMAGDELCVRGSGHPGFQHGKQYKTYDCCVAHRLELDRSGLRAGMRVAVGVSGGADSVALLRALAEAAPEIGLVLSVAHVQHGIRGAESERDAEFVQELAERLGLEFALHRVDTPAVARTQKMSLEEAARELRYAWFRSLLAEGKADAVATAHTLDDQAETVVHRVLRGAWTEGLGGIHPVIACPRGVILRPFLQLRRAEIEAYLREMGQSWREDATNADTAFTRNRIRHELLPQLAEFNPRIAEQFANLAAIARDEESWWEAELQRLLPGLVLPGRPVRGGGRAVSTHPDEGSVGMKLERLRGMAPALRRRVLRAAAEQLRCGLSFEQTERLMAMCGADSNTGAPRKQQLTAELRAERTARELRLVREAAPAQRDTAETFELPIPGEVTGLGVTLRARLVGEADGIPAAILRTPRPWDRVKLKYSRSAKPLKEIFERMGVGAEARREWPVVEWEGRLVWMREVVAEVEDVPFAVEVISTS